MSKTDDYTTIDVIIKGKTLKAVKVVPKEDPEREPVWVALSCVYGPDEKLLGEDDIGSNIQIKVMSWLVKKENLS